QGQQQLAVGTEFVYLLADCGSGQNGWAAAASSRRASACSACSSLSAGVCRCRAASCATATCASTCAAASSTAATCSCTTTTAATRSRRIVLAVRNPDVALRIDGHAMRKGEHSGAETFDHLAGGIELHDDWQVRHLSGSRVGDAAVHT